MWMTFCYHSLKILWRIFPEQRNQRNLNLKKKFLIFIPNSYESILTPNVLML